jgi:hypothetical protein
MTKSMSRIISHELSKFGKLDIALHAKSTIFYNQLEEDGLIDYLKNLEHLGFISKSHPGNNHKRWDYIMLQFYILHKLKDEVFRTGLSSNHKIDDQNQTSGLVILQIAILFANIGHLKGTLSSEIGFLNYIEQNPTFKNDFFKKIDQSPNWKPFADNIFDNKDYYKIKYLVALNYLLEKNTDPLIEKIIYLFFKNSLIDDDPKLRKLKWIFNKVRQVSFVYLDSFNSDFPFHIDITKILLNTGNYKTVFNPNSFDFDAFYDSCETTLTKKLYISEFASLLLEHNRSSFIQYLGKEVTRKGNNKLDFRNFLCSLYSRNVKSFEISNPKNQKCFQFFLSKEDIEFFGIKQELFNYQEASLENYKNESFLNTLLNKNLSEKKHRVSLIHDGRKSLYFNNLILNIPEIIEGDQKQFLINYFNVHKQFIEKFEYTGKFLNFKTIAITFLFKHYSRKVFLQLTKILFKYDYQLSAYIKFDNQQLIYELAKSVPTFSPTGYIKSKSNLLEKLNIYLTISTIPNDIKNNFRIAKHIIENVTSIKRYFNAFYCLFPIELDKYYLDPNKLYKQQNPETVRTLTDIDLLLVLFNESKFELYVIEGKDQDNGFEAAVRDDFNNRIIPNLRFTNNVSPIQIVNVNQAKGGYIKIDN